MIKDRKALSDEKWNLQTEYDNKWYEYNQEQHLIDYINRAREKIKYLKQKEANDKICDTMFKEGIEKGIENNKIEIAKDMIKKNYSEEEIINITKITKEQLLTLLKI